MYCHGITTDRIHADVFGDGPRAIFVHGSFGWGLDTFPDQRALAAAYEVVLVDRRGYGASPHVDDPGWHHDMHDVVAWLDGGAHLVGQSYGGAVCLLAAALRPQDVLSLTVIEPIAASVATDDAAARQLAAAIIGCWETGPRAAASDFLAAWHRGLGRTAPPDTSVFGPDDWTAVETTMRERPVVDAPVDLAKIASAPWPTLIVKGAWPGSAGTDWLRDGCASICRELQTRLGATLVEFENSAHNPQLQEPHRFNQLLRTFWGSLHA